MNTRNLLWAALSMTAALVMTACSSEDNAIESSAQQGTVKTIPYTVTVGQGEAATTRATVESDLKTLKFAKGDKLYISSDSRNDLTGVLTLKNGDEGKTSGATFEGSLSYTGDAPASDLELKATLVGSSNAGVLTADNKVTGIAYPTAAYCTDVNDAVEKYSNLTGTATYGAQSFSLTQQTAFLNFVITFDDGTASGTTLSAKVSNGGTAICTADVTTTTENEKVVAKFVLPVAKGTTLSSATVTMGGKEPIPFGASQTLDGKVYNVKKTQEAPAGHSLAESAVGEIVGTDGLAYAVADKDNLPTGVTAAGMVAYKSGSSGLVIALADEAKAMDWDTANGETGAAAHTPAVSGHAWILPSLDEWKQMFKANGGSEGSYSGLNEALASAGGDSSKLRVNDGYWSSTKENDANAYNAFLRTDGTINFSMLAMNSNSRFVRACFAF